MVSLERRSALAASAAALTLLVTLFACSGGASAATPYSAGGVVNACYKVKGKEKGALRLVKSSRSCKRMRGWRRVSWSAVGPQGVSGPTDGSVSDGQPGPAGPTGPAGPQGEPGSPGLVDDVEKSLLETIQKQSDQIEALTTQVQGLAGDLVDLEGVVGLLGGDVTDVEGLVGGLVGDVNSLEGVVGGTCNQLGALTERSDELLSTLENSSIAGSLPVVGSVVGLLELTLTGLPEAPLGTFEGCTVP